MKSFTHSIPQGCHSLLSRAIACAVLISLLLLVTTGSLLAVPLVVSFSQHPAPRTACAGSTASFSVTAAGSGSLVYQWQVSTNGGGNWNPVSDGSTYANSGTSALSVLIAAGTMDNYQYRCQVTDNSGTYYSNAALFTVNALPLVKTGNGSVSICANGGGSISAQLFAGLTYQWQVSTDGAATWNNLTNTSPYSGTATNMLTISSGVSLNGNLYRYIATNTVTGCQATSDHDTLHVFQPVINTQPVNAPICTGGNAGFSVAASSPLALTYQWSRFVAPNLVPLTESTTYSGTAANTMTITGATTAMNNYRYQVAVTDAQGCVTTSSLVTLNVYNPLVINTQPRDTIACANISVNNAFRVTMSSGSQPMTYQWETDNGSNGTAWSPAVAAVSSSSTVSLLHLPFVTLSMNGYRYRLSITGACGTIFSNEATLRVVADGTWRGTTNTDWHTSSNWCGGIPTSFTDVLIPNWAPRMPVISSNTAFSRALHIENNAKLTISGGTTSMIGPFNIEGTVAYTANANQPILPAPHGSLEINGSGNKLMQSDIDISNNLVLGGTAKLVTGHNLLTMKAGSNPVTGATFNGAVTSWIVTGNGSGGVGNTGIGGVRIEQVNAADGAVLYPVGATAAAYNPLLLTNTGVTDDFTIAVNDRPIPGGVFQSGIDRTWLVSESTPGGSNISLELRWADPEESPLFDRAATRMIRSDGTNIVQASASAAAGGTDPYTHSANAFTVLTQFSVASQAAMLPIVLTAFQVRTVDKTTARLNWTTDGREADGLFVIQKQTEGPAFTNIGMVSLEAGKTSYEFTDHQLGAGTSHYRLQLTVPGEQAQYSKIVKVSTPLTNHHIELRPSVTSKEQVSLYLNLSSKDRISITILDVMGRVQLQKAAPLDKGEHYLPLPVGHLIKGIYYVQVTGSYSIRQSLHLVKQ